VCSHGHGKGLQVELPRVFAADINGQLDGLQPQGFHHER
jgi:hypothetical protein